MNKFCIFLTGAIAPQNVPFLERINAEDRENDYFASIQFWMKFNLPIVFCENSNYNSPKINELFENRLDCEYIKFQTQVSHLGKGKGEAEIFEFAMKNSKILAYSNTIIKVTGRYTISNFESILSKIDSKNLVSANLTRNLSWADSRFFIFAPTFYYQYLASSSKLIDEFKGIYYEHILLKAIFLSIIEGNKFSLLPELPLIKGIYGTENYLYNMSYFKKIKYLLYYNLKKYIFYQGI